MAQGLSGSKLMTASGEVGRAGLPCRIYSVVSNSGASAGVSTFKNNGASGTTYLTLTCAVVSTSNSFMFPPKGLFFPAGAYWTKDANTDSVLVEYETEI